MAKELSCTYPWIYSPPNSSHNGDSLEQMPSLLPARQALTWPPCSLREAGSHWDILYPSKQHWLEMFSAALCVMVEPQRHTTAGMVSPSLLVPSSSALAPNLYTPLSKSTARHGPECNSTESNSVPPKLISTPHLWVWPYLEVGSSHVWSVTLRWGHTGRGWALIQWLVSF